MKSKYKFFWYHIELAKLIKKNTKTGRGTAAPIFMSNAFRHAAGTTKNAKPTPKAHTKMCVDITLLDQNCQCPPPL